MSLNIGIIGAGRLGTALARSFSKTDNPVAIVNSRGPETLTLQLQIMLPGVNAMAIEDMIAWADVLILAVPLRQFHTLPLAQMSGKIVIDAMNYWSPIDGKLREFDDYAVSSSQVVARSLPESRVVKTFNSIAYGEIEEHASQAGNKNRRAIAMAGDDEAAKQVVGELVSLAGFDPTDLGDLEKGSLFQPDTKLFNVRFTREQLLHEVAQKTL